MDFIKKHEVLFGLLGAAFVAPFILQFFGVVHFLDIDNNLLSLIFMGILAVIPAWVWIRIFNAENPEAKSTLFFAFLAGCSSTIPVFFYQKLFLSGDTGNFVFFKAEAVNFQTNIAEMFGYASVGKLATAASDGVGLAVLGTFLVFLGVGALEEVVKHVVVNKRMAIYLAFAVLLVASIYLVKDFSVGNLLYIGGLALMYLVFLRLLVHFIKFQSIDDVIEVAIVSALGFAFVENIHYFHGKWGVIPEGQFAFFVAVRVTVVTVVHVLCSGIMGYHMGLAHFAKPVLQDEVREGRRLPVIRFIHNVLQVPSEKVFFYEQVWVGVLLAVLVHACYDFFMQLQFQVFGLIPLFALVMPLYFVGGLWYLFYLLDKKEDHKKFGHVESN